MYTPPGKSLLAETCIGFKGRLLGVYRGSWRRCGSPSMLMMAMMEVVVVTMGKWLVLLGLAVPQLEEEQTWQLSRIQVQVVRTVLIQRWAPRLLLGCCGKVATLVRYIRNPIIVVRAQCFWHEPSDSPDSPSVFSLTHLYGIGIPLLQLCYFHRQCQQCM